MANEWDNEVEQEFYSSNEHSDDCEATKLVTPNVNPTSAQRPNVERDDNDGAGDSHLLKATVGAL